MPPKKYSGAAGGGGSSTEDKKQAHYVKLLGEEHHAIFSRFSPDSTVRVIDLGCGNAEAITKALQTLAARARVCLIYLGVDISDKNTARLNECFADSPHITFQTWDAADLRHFEESKADIVLGLHAEFISTPAATAWSALLLGTMPYLLREGGQFIATGYSEPEINVIDQLMNFFPDAGITIKKYPRIESTEGPLIAGAIQNVHADGKQADMFADRYSCRYDLPSIPLMQRIALQTALHLKKKISKDESHLLVAILAKTFIARWQSERNLFSLPSVIKESMITELERLRPEYIAEIKEAIANTSKKSRTLAWLYSCKKMQSWARFFAAGEKEPTEIEINLNGVFLPTFRKG